MYIFSYLIVVIKVLDDATILDVLGVVALESLVHLVNQFILNAPLSLSCVALKSLIHSQFLLNKPLSYVALKSLI